MSSAPSGQTWIGLDAALRAASAIHGMEASCFVTVSASAATYQRTTGALPGLEPGLTVGRETSLVARMLDGAPAADGDVPADPALGTSAEYTRLGVHSYVAVPVLAPDGELLGVLAGLDRRAIAVHPDVITFLRGIADALGASRSFAAAPGRGEALPPSGTERPADATPTPTASATVAPVPGVQEEPTPAATAAP